MGNLGNFNPNDHEEMSDFTPIPDGRYVAVIEESEMRETRAGDGHYLKLTWKILEGEFKNRFVWDNLNLMNPSVKAMEIAKRNLATICKAVGLNAMVSDSSQLHGRPVQIKVVIRPPQNGYEAANDVRGYAKAPGHDTIGTAHGTPAPVGSNGGAKPPWETAPVIPADSSSEKLPF